MTPQVGMKVRIRPDLKVGVYTDIESQNVLPEMLPFAGKIATITEVWDNTLEFKIHIDDTGWLFNRKMLAPTSILKARPCNRK